MTNMRLLFGFVALCGLCSSVEQAIAGDKCDFSPVPGGALGRITSSGSPPENSDEATAQEVGTALRARILRDMGVVAGTLFINQTNNCDLTILYSGTGGGSVLLRISTFSTSACCQILQIPPPTCSGGGSQSILEFPSAAKASSSHAKAGPGSACPAYLTRTARSSSGMQMVLEDWAVVEDGIVLASSSPLQEQAVEECLEEHVSEASANLSLFVGHVDHAENDRFMPKPTVELKPGSRRGLATHLQRGNHILRVEVGEDTRINSVEYLGGRGSMTRQLEALVRSGLTFSYRDDRRHQFTYHALLTVQEGRVEVVNSLVTLPQCCPP